MTGTHKFIKKFDNFDQITVRERQRLGKLVASYARKAAIMMAAKAPRSDINESGYAHFADQFEAQQIAPWLWGIVNHKIVNGYALWMLLEHGTRHMAPRKTIGPVMDIIGPEFLKEAGKFEK
jgi:hypothetical protein